MGVKKTFLTGLVMLLVATGVAVSQTAAPTHETSSEVPALTAFHEVIYPLWHEAWPNKNLSLMRELLPQVEKGVAEIQSAELPGILRDKKSAWQEGVAALASAAGKMKTALDAGQEQAALDAVEDLHARFEQLARVTHPVMKELDAYHVVLYDIYHKLLPAKDFAKIAVASKELDTRCATLAAAQVPRRFTAKEAELKKGFSSLCEATATLTAATGGADTAAIVAAVETVHGQYQAVEGLFK